MNYRVVRKVHLHLLQSPCFLVHIDTNQIQTEFQTIPSIHQSDRVYPSTHEPPKSSTMGIGPPHPISFHSPEIPGHFIGPKWLSLRYLMLQMHTTLVGGSIPTPLKNDGLKVSWDDDFSQLNGKIYKNVPNHQPAYTYSY